MEGSHLVWTVKQRTNKVKNMAILQWNCRGFYRHIDQIQILAPDSQILCLQETYNKTDKPIALRGFTAYNTHPVVDHRATGGSSILVRDQVAQSPVSLRTCLQATAVKVTMNITFTICNIYLPPSSALNPRDLNDLIDQLPTPFLLLGDLNAHSPAWGSPNTDGRGRTIENAIDRYDLAVLNSGDPTYHNISTGSKTAIDVALCTPDLFLSFSWNTIPDLHDSDHLPISISQIENYEQILPERWIHDKADWESFRSLCVEELTTANIIQGEHPLERFATLLLDIMKRTIPRSSGKKRKQRKPWFNDDCKNAINNRRKS